MNATEVRLEDQNAYYVLPEDALYERIATVAEALSPFVAVKAHDLAALLLGVLTAIGDGMTVDDIFAAIGPSVLEES